MGMNNETNNAAQTNEITIIQRNGFNVQQLTIQISLGGVEREVTIERLTEKHCWVTTIPVTCKYRTGNKFHQMRVQVVQSGESWKWVYSNSHGKRGVRPVAWVDVVSPNARW
jgi:hypothetical protein